MKTSLFVSVLALLSVCACDRPDPVGPATALGEGTPASSAPAQPAPTKAVEGKLDSASSNESPVTPLSAASPYSVIDVDAKTAVELIANTPGLVVLDIRTPSEFAAGHIEGAVNVDFKAADFGAKLDSLDKSGVYLVHCRSGGRSTGSLPQFEERSFGTIYHLSKGYASWEK